jgi:glycosyltransferase involved in cell wall biosynthesis
VKILHVEGGRNLYGGALQVLYLIEGLKARGVENLLACRTGSDIGLAAKPFAEVRGMKMEGDMDVLLIPRLYRLIRATRPDIVHLHSRIGADVMGGIAARLAGVPIVHSRRQDNPEKPWMVALKYRLHDRVVAISEGIGEVLMSEGLSPARLRIVRSAVEARPFQQPADKTWFRAEFGLPEGSLVMGVVAQLISRKGHRFLLQAMPRLMERFPALYVIFFGKGPAEADLREQARKLGLDGRVRLAGFRDDLPRILPCLDLLVHPALMEGLGVSLLQAASAGVPIVASRAGGIPEAVRDGLNGLLVPPGDVAALGEAIGRVLGDPALARRLGEAGRDLVAREFSVDGMVEGNLRVYRELLEERASNGATRA